MDSQRNLLFIAWLFVSFLIWQAWTTDHQTAQANLANATSQAGMVNVVSSSQEQVISVKTDVLNLSINLQGGDIDSAQLLAYPATLNDKTPFQLLETTPSFVYQAQSGLTGKDGIDNPDNGPRPLYQASAQTYQLADGQQTLTVPLTYTAANGAKYQKIFTFTRGQYDVNVAYDINNQTQVPLNVEMFGQLKQTVDLPKERDNSSHNFALHTYRGAAFSSDDEKYKKYSFSDIEDKSLDESTSGGWVAMLQQYFASAWIPQGSSNNQLYSRNLSDGVAAIGYKSATVTVPAGASQQLSAVLWIGPELQEQMAAVAPNLDMTVDYGWLWFLSQPLFKLLKFIHSFIGNWGFSIIVITFIVRGIMYPLTKAQYTSMAKMRMLQPKIQAMRERFGEDKQRMSQEMMALYKKEKVNPLGGCFPVIIQMPIFLALYYMLMASVELRHAPFILWIRDLSAQDPYYILPILMGLTMYFIQKLSPAAVSDPMQQKIMNFMPVIFTVFFLWFPSGLVLYYIVSNLVTIIQQQLIYRGLEKRGLHSRQKKNAN